jgi:hypothetical protein
MAQVVGVKAPIRDETLAAARCFGQHLRRGSHVAGVAGRQVDDGRPPEDVGEEVDLGRLTAA